MEQGQDEFYFALPYQEMDVALWCYNNEKNAEELERILDLERGKAELIYRDIERKRAVAKYLHAPAFAIQN